MEVFAGFGEYADFEVGRLIQAIEDLGQLDNTLVFYIVGDNGASAEGTHERPVQRDDLLQRRARNRPGHSQALSTISAARIPTATTPPAGPWRATRRSPGPSRSPAATAACRNGMVVHWPKGITAKGEVRSQWHHVIDIAPTILEAAGLPEPKSVNGTPQTPIEGVSMLYTFADAKAKDRHKTQYFEIFGNRGIYHDGWLAHTVHRAAWESKPRRPLLEDKWELYHVDEDFSSANDLAAKNPEKLKELQELFLKEAVKNQASAARRPLARAHERRPRRPPRPDGRPHVADGLRRHDRHDARTSSSTPRTARTPSPPRSRFPKGGANGVILAQAGRFGGWSLYLKDGKPTYAYNFLGLQTYKVAATEAAARGQGDHPLRVRLRRRRPGQGRHGHDPRQRREGRRRADRPDAGRLSSRRTKGRTSAWMARRP